MLGCHKLRSIREYFVKTFDFVLQVLFNQFSPCKKNFYNLTGFLYSFQIEDTNLDLMKQ